MPAGPHRNLGNEGSAGYRQASNSARVLSRVISTGLPPQDGSRSAILVDSSSRVASPPAQAGWAGSTGFRAMPSHAPGSPKTRLQYQEKRLRAPRSSIAGWLKSSTIGMITAFVTP